MKIRCLAAIFAAVAMAGCDGQIVEPEESADSAFEPAGAVMPRLTSTQYRNSIVDLFGPEAPVVATPPDTNPYLFYSIGAASTELSELDTQVYADAAAALSTWALSDPARRDAIVGCAPASADDPCIAEFLRDVGLRLFRRPLGDDELAQWQAVVQETARGSVDRGLRMALYGMLQSPHFLYRAEVGEPDPDDPSRRRYTSYEMAQRLSFLLWNAPPDDELLEAAERGELVDPAAIQGQALRLLASPRARDAVGDFFAQYLDLGKLEGVERDVALYPAYTPSLIEAMATELRLVVDDLVFRRDTDVRELFSSRRTFVNAELAALYGIEAAGATDVAFVPVELPVDGPRAGILTSGAFLTMNAHHTVTSPTLRGKYVRERVLCQTVTPPPNDAELSVDDGGEEPRTLRERLSQHTTDPLCASCHTFIDPPGFLFESFDAIGAHRTEDNGFPVDTSGDLDGVPLDDARDLAEVLATDERVSRCIVKQLYRHAQGRLDTPGEDELLRQLDAAFADSGYRFQDLLLELVTSEGFRTVSQEVAR